MSMKRRFLAAALTAALMVSMLSGCASSKKDTQSDTAGSCDYFDGAA